MPMSLKELMSCVIAAGIRMEQLVDNTKGDVVFVVPLIFNIAFERH